MHIYKTLIALPRFYFQIKNNDIFAAFIFNPYLFVARAANRKSKFLQPLMKWGEGQITISSDPSPLFGIQSLAIPLAFDFAFKMHIKEKSFKHCVIMV